MLTIFNPFHSFGYTLRIKFSKFGVHLTKQQAIVGEKLSWINARVIKSDEGHGPEYKIFISLCRQTRQTAKLRQTRLPKFYPTFYFYTIKL